jgi:glycosyltransferase involved in cell wall biosynthesis
MAEALVGRGHQVTVFTTNSNLDEELDVPLDRPLDVEGVKVWYFRHDDFLKRWFAWASYISRSLGLLYAPQMVARLEQVVPQVDLVHTHMPFVYPTFAAARAAYRFRKPLFYHQRGVFDPNRLRFRSLKKKIYIHAIERPIARRATTLIALTKAEVASYRALGLNTPCRIVPNGVTVGDFLPRASAPRSLRWSNITPETLVVLFLGRLHPIKGADRLLRAFLRIQPRFPQAVLVMAGPDEWGLEVRFRKIMRTGGGQGRVVFPGMVSGRDKLELLARADLFCLPSDGEGFSMAVLEAMASATAVLLSPGCHFPEAESVGAGRIVAPDPEALAEGLGSFLANPERLKAMGEKARAFVANHYSWEPIVDQLLDVYTEGIERNRKRWKQ